MVYAVIDTNVLVSAMLRWDSIPGVVVEQATVGKIIPALSDEIMAEYEEVLHRKKFPFLDEDIKTLLGRFNRRGVFFHPAEVADELPDTKDVVFYAVTMAVRRRERAYLVTGNVRHFPSEPYIVTPREMLAVLKDGE